MQGIKKWSRDNARFHIDFTNFEKNEFYKLYKTLIQYRKENFETLSKGELNFFETSEIIGYEYKTINKEIMVIMNLTDHEITHDFIGYKNIFKNTNTLKPYEATVLEK
ncbi:MAG: hypothetical protein BWY78_01025 [Alphaproteobacteria bacterium ADurb.Bin438]|nr:MAG: hypothetical protein BWY78_01025 [Alphaproteobacteria bacterium ADurb.Bin438]